MHYVTVTKRSRDTPLRLKHRHTVRLNIVKLYIHLHTINHSQSHINIHLFVSDHLISSPFMLFPQHLSQQNRLWHRTGLSFEASDNVQHRQGDDAT